MMIMITIINNHHDQVCKDSLEKTEHEVVCRQPGAGLLARLVNKLIYAVFYVPLYLLNKDFCAMCILLTFMVNSLKRWA